MKAFLKKKIEELKAKKTLLLETSKTSEDVAELKSINTQMETVNAELDEFEKQLALILAEEKEQADEKASKSFNPISQVYGLGGQKKETTSTEEITKELEKQGEILKGNDVTEKTVVLSQEILVPRHMSNEIKKLPWNEVSSILDLVNVLLFTNGESHSVPFEYEVGEGGYTDEVGADGTGGMYTDTETKFDYSTVGKSFVTAYAEISRQFLKAPSADYATRVRENILVSLRKKLAKDIFIGAGGSNTIQGIFTQPAKIMNADGKTERDNRVIGKDLSVSALTPDLINDIVFNYGGDTDVESSKVLVMNLQTLNELSKIRDNNGNRIYDITVDGNKFTIDKIKGIFTSHIKAFSECAEGEYFIGYGDPFAYELALYSTVNLGESRDYKFKQGIICYSGDIFVGGNLTAYQSWTRVSKKA